MNFFNDIGRGFQDFGNQINNEVIKPAENTLDPTKNGISQTILKDPIIKQITNDPIIKTTIQNTNINNFNNALSQLHSIFNNPSNVLHITDPIKNGIVNGFDPTKNGISNLILNDPNIKKVVSDPTIKKIIQNTNPTTINNTLKNAFDPKKNGVADAFDPKKNGVTDVFSGLGGGGGQVQTNTTDNTSMYIIIGAVLVGMYAFIPNKKTVNNKI
jgi:hypothetical protein